MAQRYLTAKIEFGRFGFMGRRNPSRMPLGSFVDTESVAFRGGSIEKAPGLVAVNPDAITGNPSIVAGKFFSHDAIAERHILVGSNGSVYKFDGNGALLATLATGLVIGNTFQFVEGGKEGAALNRKLFLFTGTNQVKVLSGDGSTMTDLATPPTDWTSLYPTVGAVFEGRLVGAGNANDPHRLYFSTTTDHENFVGTGSFTLSVFPGEGQGISAIVPVKDGLLIFKKPRGIYLVDATDPVTSNWRIFKLSGDAGLPSPNAISQISGDKFIFLDVSGRIRMLAFNQQLGLSVEDVLKETDLGYFIQTDVNINALDKARVVHFYPLNETMIFVPEAGAGINTIAITINFAGENAKMAVSKRDVVHSAWLGELNESKLFVGGDNDGKFYVYRDDVFTKNGVAYASTFKTSEIDFSEFAQEFEFRNKALAFLEIEYIPTSPVAFKVDVFHDGKLSETISFTTVASSGILGSFVLGESSLGSSEFSRIAKRRLTGQARKIQFALSDLGAQSRWTINNFNVVFGVSDERL